MRIDVVDLSLMAFSLNAVKTASFMNIGAWSWYAAADENLKWGFPAFYELNPPLIQAGTVNFRPLARTFGETPRSLEIWWDGELARIIYATDTPAALTAFRQAYPGLDVNEIKEHEPSWVKTLEKAPVFFDAEQMHGLAFCKFIEEHRGELLNHLIGALEGTGPAWIQIITSAWDFSRYAEAFANSMDYVISKIQEGEPTVKWGMSAHGPIPSWRLEKEAKAEYLGSTIGKYGGLISREAVEKGQLASAVVHVRGLLTDPETTKTLPAAVKSGIRVSYDYPELLPYDDARLLRWMRARNYPNPDAPLSNLASFGFIHKWSIDCKRGCRTLIPVFCAVPSELAVFNCLPTDDELPVKFIKPHPPRVYRPPKEKRGVEL
jgi:hypothetical protein